MAKNTGKVKINLDETMETIEKINNTVSEIDDKAKYNLRNISLDQIQPNDKNNFGMRDIEEIAESLKEHGQLHNIVVRKIEDEEKPYRLISGERRWRAALSIGMKELAARIVECDDTEEEMLLIVANLETRELNDIEKSNNAKRLAELISEKRKNGEDFGGKKTREIVAEKMGMQPAQVQKLLKLDKLIPEFKKMVEDKEIALELANQYAQMAEETQKLVYESIQSVGLKLSAKEAKELKDKLKEEASSKDKIIEEMKETLKKKDEEIKGNQEIIELNKKKLKEIEKLSSEKDATIKKLHTEMIKIQDEANEEKELIDASKEKIRAEIEEELKKNNKDLQKVKDLEKQLEDANNKISVIESESEEKVNKLKEQLESTKSEVEELSKQKEKKEIDTKSIEKNVEIVAMSKQVSKLLSSLTANIAIAKKEGVTLSEDSMKNLETIKKMVEGLKN